MTYEDWLLTSVGMANHANVRKLSDNEKEQLLLSVNVSGYFRRLLMEHSK